VTSVQQSYRYSPVSFPAGRLDARDWPFTSGPYNALSHPFVIRSNDPQIHAALARMFRTLAAEPAEDTPPTTYSFVHRGLKGNSRRRYVIYANDERLAFAESVALGIRSLMWQLNYEAVHSVAPSHVVLHAAAAEYGDTGILLPASMNSGKTTTVAGLIADGFCYLTDEAAAVDPVTLRITPYLKPLSIDEGSFGVVDVERPDFATAEDPQWQVSPLDVKAAKVGSGRPCTLIVAPRYEAGARTRLRTLTKGELTMLLASNAFCFADDAERNLTTLARLASVAPGYELTIGDLSSAVAAVRSLVDPPPAVVNA
jgi:hypothetical protein